VDFLVSFLIGFIGIWLVSNISMSKPMNCMYKEPMVAIAKIYGSNTKISKELTVYSLDQIKNGNYEYAEVIDMIKRRKNDKTRD